MSQKQKLIDKLKNAKITDFEDIDLLLRLLGFTVCNAGSHYTYTKAPDYIIGIVRRSGKPVKRVYLENLRDLLERMGI